MSVGTNGGGKPEKKPLEYCPPQGPKGQSHEGPGLGGSNHGQSGGQQGRH